jgi:predicted acyltransferase
MLMIFVNDLWTLTAVPKWLLHVPANVDGLGLSDVIFPAFLFIVGLSIPFAIKNRWEKGAADLSILKHVLFRSVALLIMGIFHVNLEVYQPEIALLSKPVWQLLLTLSFFLIWMDYPKEGNSRKKWTGKIAGAILLLFLAITYRGGTVSDPVWMGFYWWGILGLIGWAYLIASVVYLFTQGKLAGLWIAFLICFSFSVLGELGLLDFMSGIRPYVWLIDNGATPALALAGVLVTTYYSRFFKNGKAERFWKLIGFFALISFVLGLVTRPLWGIHKIGSSPSWVLLCISISIVSFAFLIWLVEIKQRKQWFNMIKPAGTSTLTCYLLPYIHYALLTLSGLVLPEFLRDGWLGIFKSLIYAFIIIQITGLLEKRRLRLKI